jgi:hypothetical protein
MLSQRHDKQRFLGLQIAGDRIVTLKNGYDVHITGISAGVYELKGRFQKSIVIALGWHIASSSNVCGAS